MKIQPINQFQTYGNYIAKKQNEKVNAISFERGTPYTRAMHDVLYNKDFRSHKDVNLALIKLFLLFVDEGKISPKAPLLEIVEGKGVELVQKLADVNDKANAYLSAMFKGNKDLVIRIKGTRNSMRVVNPANRNSNNPLLLGQKPDGTIIDFKTRNGHFTVGVNNDGNVTTERVRSRSGVTTEDTYSLYGGGVISSRISPMKAN